MTQDLEQQILDLDRKFHRTWTEYLKVKDSHPGTDKGREDWNKANSLLKEMDDLELKRLELSDRLTTSIGS